MSILNEAMEKYKNMNFIHEFIYPTDWTITIPPIPISIFHFMIDDYRQIKPNWKDFVEKKNKQFFSERYNEYLLTHVEETDVNDPSNPHTKIKKLYNMSDVPVPNVLNSQILASNTPDPFISELDKQMKFYLRQDFYNTPQLDWTKTDPPFAMDFIKKTNSLILSNMFRQKKGSHNFNFDQYSKFIQYIKDNYRKDLWDKYKKYLSNHPSDSRDIIQKLNTKFQEYDQGGTTSNFGSSNNKHNNGILRPFKEIPDDVYVLILQYKDIKERDTLLRLYSHIDQLPNGAIKEQYKLNFKENLKKFDYKIFLEKYKIILLTMLLSIFCIYVFSESFKDVQYLLKTRNFNDLKKGLDNLLLGKGSGIKIPRGTTSEENPVFLSNSIPIFIQKIKFANLTNPIYMLDITKDFLGSFGTSLNKALTPIGTRRISLGSNQTYYNRLSNLINKFFQLLTKILNSSTETSSNIVKKFKSMLKLLVSYLIKISETQV